MTLLELKGKLDRITADSRKVYMRVGDNIGELEQVLIGNIQANVHEIYNTEPITLEFSNIILLNDREAQPDKEITEDEGIRTN